jgi:hypothetical protein
MLERFVLAILGQFIRFGQLTVITPGGRRVCLGVADNGPRAEITVHDRKTLRRLVTRPDLEFGEAYMDGRLTPGEEGLEPLMDLILKNSPVWAGHWTGRLTLMFGNMLSVFRHLNLPGRSRRNVAHHYDLTDELFETFLDPWRQIPVPIAIMPMTRWSLRRSPSLRVLPPSDGTFRQNRVGWHAGTCRAAQPCNLFRQDCRSSGTRWCRPCPQHRGASPRRAGEPVADTLYFSRRISAVAGTACPGHLRQGMEITGP